MGISTDSVTTKTNRKTDFAYQAELRHNPKSFLKLILLGFSIVGLPLIAALVYSAIRIDQLADQSRDTIYSATQITYGSSILIDEIIVMECANANESLNHLTNVEVQLKRQQCLVRRRLTSTFTTSRRRLAFST